MTDVDAVLDANRIAVNELLAAAEKSGAAWAAPRAPGKWSPSQIVEHVALSLEESANVVSGAPSKFPTFPRLFRPVARRLFFNRVLRKNAFPRARTGKAFDPPGGPATPSEARVRLEAALARFDRECRALAADGRHISSTIFGTVKVNDYARFMELHTRHHGRQLRGTNPPG